MKGIAVGEALLLFGLLLLAWVVYTQQEEIAMLAQAVGKAENVGAVKATAGGVPPLPVDGRTATTTPAPPVEPEVPVNAPPPPPPPTPPDFQWPPGSVGAGGPG